MKILASLIKKYMNQMMIVLLLEVPVPVRDSLEPETPQRLGTL
jgi:hypothetical protein